MKILSGKVVAEEIQREIKEKIFNHAKKPHLAVLLIGSHAPSHTYVGVKRKACMEVGIELTLHKMGGEVSEKEVLKKIEEYNQNPLIHGILVQLPLPAQINSINVLEKIHPEKDVDGFHPINMGKLLLGLPGGFTPCTPLGIQVLLQRYQIPVEGRHVVIVGRSNIVGKPLAALLMQKKKFCNATVTIAHGATADLASLTLTADILVAAVGSPRFIQAPMVKEGATVVDVGIHKIVDPQDPRGYTIIGDVDYTHVAPKCAAISPVPQGVGPMTVAMLLQNTLNAFEK